MQKDQNKALPPLPNPPAQPSQPNPELHAQPVSKPNVDPIPDLPPGEYTYSERPRKRLNSNQIKNLISFAQLIVGALLLAFFINHFVFQSYEVVGSSMVPTLHENDRLIILKLGKSWSKLTHNQYIPEPGQIIVLHNPRDPATQLIKRVIGVGGDRVIVEDGQVSVCPAQDPDNCYDPNQAYNLDLDPAVGHVNLTVPDGNVFVMGDNRGPGGSLDSRNELGVVPLDNIVGNLVLRIMPLSDARVF